VSPTRPVSVVANGGPRWQRDLVAEEVEVDPAVGAAALAAAEHAAVERARGLQIVHVVGQMEQGFHLVAS
jgi:hypothetical protein